MITFNSFTDDQIDLMEDNFLGEGWADACITQHSVGPSKFGETQLKVSFDAEDEQGKKGKFTDWFLIESTDKFQILKFKRFMIAYGHEKQYKSGRIEENSMCGSWAKALLKKSKDNKYLNAKEYVAYEKPRAAAEPLKFDPDNDDVPF
jgi:hypothetical protein